MKEYVSVTRKLDAMGFNQKEIAILLNISQPTVSNIINGKYDPEPVKGQMSLFEEE